MSVDYSQGSAAPPPPQKKGMGPLGWIAIGCGLIIVLCIVAFGVMGYFVKRKVDTFKQNPTMAAAELMVQMNPDLEMVSKDEGKGTITVKNKKSGETGTVNLEDAKNGKFEFKSDKGTVSINANSKDGGFVKMTDDKGRESVISGGTGAPKNLPSWLPAYPGGTAQGTLDANTADGHSGAFTVTSKDAVDKVMDYYEAQLKAAGLKVEKATFNAGGKNGGSVNGKSDDGKRTAAVILSTDDSGTQAMVTFNDKP